MVIDGVLDPVAYAGTKATRSMPTTLRIKSAEATWNALTDGLAACAAAGPDYCPLANPRGDFDQVAAALKAAPKGVPIYNGSEVLNYTYTTSSPTSSTPCTTPTAWTGWPASSPP